MMIMMVMKQVENGDHDRDFVWKCRTTGGIKNFSLVNLGCWMQ